MLGSEEERNFLSFFFSYVGSGTGYVFTRTLHWVQNWSFYIYQSRNTWILFSDVGLTLLNSDQAYFGMRTNHTKITILYKRRFTHSEGKHELVFLKPRSSPHENSKIILIIGIHFSNERGGWYQTTIFTVGMNVKREIEPYWVLISDPEKSRTEILEWRVQTEARDCIALI